ncbi:hypothetical protein [uncultured Aquimarina sp.]|uniref:hypothetical protein n=1 Tax=uncultured Aquimarina sp. TaxID=575652 RepID=UPI0026026223|nr:hypothetical protein [uncultured Aquimarina sp.]
MKNILFIVHSIVLVVTIILHMKSIYFKTAMVEVLGLIAQSFLGVFQVVTALCFFIGWKKHHKILKRNLMLYWIIVFVYAAFAYVYYNTISFDIIDEKFVAGVIPICIALYFVMITYINKKNTKNAIIS